MKPSYLFSGLASLTLLAAANPAVGAELKPQTLEAWNQYISTADLQMQARLQHGSHFLWTDELAGRADRLRRGEILIAPMVGSGTRHVPDGLIHHWVGASFIPGASLENVLAVTHAYARYKQIYGPKIVESRLLACNDGEQRYSLLWMNNILFATVALESQYEARDFPVDDRRFYNIAHVVETRQIEAYGEPQQHALPPDRGDGFIWRVQSIVRYEQRDGGVYLELEAIALTRDIPAALRLMANPLVAHVSRTTLAASLRQTRDAALTPVAGQQPVRACRTSVSQVLPVQDGISGYAFTGSSR